MRKQDAERNSNGSDATLAIRKILVPTDLSPIADDALEYALEIARQTRATVEVMTVLGGVEGDVFNPIRYSPEASAEHETTAGLVGRSLRELIGRHDTSDVSVTTSIRKGHPLSGILSSARQARADLLVVGTHDRGVIRHFLVRSLADDLVRRAPESVLVVHEHDVRPPESVQRVLVPIDLSGVSSGLLRYAAYVASWFGARLDVLHVVEPIPLLDTFAGALTIRDMVPGMKRHSTAELKKLIDDVDLLITPENVYVDEGHVASIILDRARNERADLIVVGKRGRSAIERFFIGSVTERVVRHAPCPVLVADAATLHATEATAEVAQGARV